MLALHLFHHTRQFPLRTIILFCFPLFFIFLADSAMSYMFPVLVERTTHSSAILGVVMALSSLLGILCDFSFPQLLGGRSWKFQLTAGIVLALFFPIFSSLGAAYTLFYFFVLATLIWGVYFEFLQFSQQGFVIREEETQEYSKDWGILYFCYAITAIVGPILGSVLLHQHVFTANIAVNVVQIISLLFAIVVIVILPNHRSSKRESSIKETFHVLREIAIWEKLGEKIWPVILSGITVSFVSASYWTIGGLLGREIAGKYGLDWLVMVLYGVPLLLGSFILTRRNFSERKKRLSQVSLLLGGLLLSMIWFVRDNSLGVLLIIGLSSFVLSFAGPLNEAVYSDLLERSGKSRLHLLGIAKSNTSLAYIIAPLFTGFLAQYTDYYITFSAVGAIALGVAILLLIFTPKKLKLPTVVAP